MKPPISALPPEYHDWVDGLEPAWTSIDPDLAVALLAEPTACNGPLRLTEDLTDDGLAYSAFVSNALVLLHAAAKDDELKLTARGGLAQTRAVRPVRAVRLRRRQRPRQPALTRERVR